MLPKEEKPSRFSPETGDVVIRIAKRNGRFFYVLHTAPGPDQFLLVTPREALAHALKFAERQHAQAWFRADNDFVLLDDFRERRLRGGGPDWETLALRPKPDRRRQPRIPLTDDVDCALQRIRAEYLEMPGLCLTREQTRRLCGVEQALCRQVLDLLVEMRFLSLKPNGTYARVADGPDQRRPQSVKADLRPAPSAKQAS